MARALKPEHLQAAFQAMAWEGWTYEAAMADPTRKTIVSWRARQICDAQAKAGRRVVMQRTTSREKPARRNTSGRYWPATVQDLKRAAAGDRDD